ncbi:MAG: SurA N-terminal domain-containing protein, partial [Rhodospirillales bacterium]|nr:SurA N-terminal domain-containing protein [Rhodospirillales bacterium]
VRRIGTSSWIAKVGGHEISPAQFNEVYSRDLSLAEQRLPEGQNVTTALRRQVANAALDQEIAQAALADELARLRIVVPDQVVRQTIFAMPAFQGPGGTFDRARLTAALAANNISEDRLIAMVSGQLAQQQLGEAIASSVAAPGLLADRLYRYAAEQRAALIAPVPFAAVPAPSAPDEAALRRYYANHPWRYRIPAYRRIRVVALTAESLGKTLTVSDAEIAAYYAAHRAAYVTPEKRAVEVLVAHDAAGAAALAAKWKAGADWAAMQAAAKAAGATAVALAPGTAGDLPDAALAKAAFAAKQGDIVGPLATPLGFEVLRVARIVPAANETLQQAHDAIAAQLRADRASSRIYDVVHQVNDVLGTGAGLGKLPGDLGLMGAEGTLDAKGMTEAGKKAPLPGSPALRAAILKAAFAADPGQPPAEMTEVAGSGAEGPAWFALAVEKVIPPGVKKFAAVRDQVQTQWIAARRRAEAERIATRVLTAVAGGQTLSAAAAANGLGVHPAGPVGRQGDGPAGSAAIPPALRQVLFGLAPGKAGMVQTADGFLLVTPAAILHPDPAKAPAQFAGLRDALARARAQDAANAFAAALRVRAQPRIDHAQLDSFVNNGQ